MSDEAQVPAEDEAEAPVSDGPRHPFADLPEPIRPEDMVAETDVTTAPDPEGGRDTETEFMLRYM